MLVFQLNRVTIRYIFDIQLGPVCIYINLLIFVLCVMKYRAVCVVHYTYDTQVYRKLGLQEHKLDCFFHQKIIQRDCNVMFIPYKASLCYRH